VRRALKILADREVSPQTGLLKSTLLQLDSTFSERSYGASSFLDFVEKLSQAGVVLLKHSGRSVMVELNPGYADEGESAKPRPEPEAAPPEAADNVVAFRPATEHGESGGTEQAVAEPATRLGDNADGVRAAMQLLSKATNARWPMYLRNVKQILRAGNFDERRYAFGGLMELLKACQRDGLVRIERDRRGGLRVFQGPNMARSTQAPEPQEIDGNITGQQAAATDAVDDVADVPVQVTDESEPDVIEIEPVSVVDTTAELLGRAKPRAPRTRASRTGTAAASASPTSRTRSTGTRKTAKKTATAGKRTTRSRKAADKNDDDFGNR
jgi:hypothetical protein